MEAWGSPKYSCTTSRWPSPSCLTDMHQFGNGDKSRLKAGRVDAQIECSSSSSGLRSWNQSGETGNRQV